MSEYKLVPVEPTPEMVSAAEDAYMPFGDMDLALRMAILAAPAVQGEPVGEVRFELGAPSSIFAELYSKSLPVLAPGTKLYTAPQPAEHQPCPEGIREGAPYDDPAFESLCREHEIWGTAAAAQCAVFWEAGKRVAEQQPAPDVGGLLNRIIPRIDAGSPNPIDPDIHCCEWTLHRERERIHAEFADALAAHRKGGES